MADTKSEAAPEPSPKRKVKVIVSPHEKHEGTYAGGTTSLKEPYEAGQFFPRGESDHVLTAAQVARIKADKHNRIAVVDMGPADEPKPEEPKAEDKQHTPKPEDKHFKK